MKMKLIIPVLFLLPTYCILAIANNFEKTTLGISASIDHSTTVELQVYSPSVIRVLKSQKGFDFNKESLSVIKSPEKGTFTISEIDSTVSVSTELIKVDLNLVTGKVMFSVKGDIMLQEKDFGVQFTPFNDAGKESFLARQAFKLDKDEAIYGLGQFQNGKMVQRNLRAILKNRNHDITIPYFYSLKGYSVFWDNYASTTFTDNQQETSFESLGDCADYYFMYGGTGDETIALMRELTGHAPMFPLWTYGYWQSKERYKSQFEVVDVLKKYRDLQVPIDGMIQDWRYWGEDSVWNAMQWNPERYPDPDGFAKQIHDLNAHLMVVAWPGFGPKTEQHQLFKEKKMLINFDTWPPKSGTKPYDVYNPEARDIYWNYLNKGVFSSDVDAWWLDSTEPDHINVKPRDFEQPTHLGSYQSVSNAFSLMHTTGIYNNQRKTTNKKRVYILTRSAFAGQQRNAATSWSGDVVSDWDVLRTQISSALNFSVCGVPYWNSDIGGFFTWNYPGGKDNVAYRELYVRWMQFGAVCPMMRSHGTNTPREIWQFGDRGDWEFDAIEKYIQLRYRLIPYLYSTAWQVTSKAGSFMRPLAFDFINDEKVYHIDNQYMFGESFMVCPVTEAMYTNFDKNGNKYVNAKEEFTVIKKTNVYLPKGTIWYDFWTGEKIQGGQTIERATPIDIMPLYIKAGSIIPWGPKAQFATEKKWDNLELKVYTGKNGSFILYEDEFDNYNYEKGAFTEISINWDNSNRKLIIGDRKGSYNGMLLNRKFSVILDDGSRKTVTYNGKKVVIKF